MPWLDVANYDFGIPTTSSSLEGAHAPGSSTASSPSFDSGADYIPFDSSPEPGHEHTPETEASEDRREDTEAEKSADTAFWEDPHETTWNYIHGQHMTTPAVYVRPPVQETLWDSKQHSRPAESVRLAQSYTMPKPGGSAVFRPVNTLDTATPRSPATTNSARKRIQIPSGFLQRESAEDAISPTYEESPGKRQKTRHEVIEVLDDEPPRGNSTNRLSAAPVNSFRETSNLFEPRRKSKRNRRSYTNMSGDELQVDPETTSKHFPATNGHSRINHSTTSRTGANNNANEKNATRPRDLRHSFHRGNQGFHRNEEDELASGIIQSRGVHKTFFSQEKGKPGPLPRPPRKSSIEKSVPEWALSLARSNELLEREPGLILKHRDTKCFDIERLVGLNQREVIATIDLHKINQVFYDEEGRMQLTGSSSPSHGRQYRYDLQFSDMVGFEVFRERHAKPACIKQESMRLKQGDYLKKVFNMPFTKNTRHEDFTNPDRCRETEEEPSPERGARSLSGNVQHETHSHGSNQSLRPKQPRKLLINQMATTKAAPETKFVPNASQGRANGTSHKAPDLVASQLTISRPTRATRSSLSSYHDLDEDHENLTRSKKAPIRYSVEYGLGERWDKPVQYESGHHRATVEFDDLLRLDEGEYLNDQLIDFYMIYLFEQAKIPRDTVYFFNTHFYSALTSAKKGINYSRVERWTTRAKIDLFTYDYVVVPVCESTHWYLAIICNIGNFSRKPILDNSSDPPIPSPISRRSIMDNPSNPSIGSPVRANDNQLPGDIKALSFTASSEPVAGGVDSGSDEDPMLLDEELRNDNEPNIENTIIDLEQPDIVQLKQDNFENEIPKGIIGDAALSPSSTKKQPTRQGKKYDPDEPIIIILDSLGLPHPKTTRALKDYIVEEARAKRSMEAPITANAVYAKDIPMQDNYTDCGVYLLGYLQKFFSNPRDFVTKVVTREMDRESDWPNMNAPDIRHKLRDLLQGLYEDQREERRASRKARKPQTVAKKHTPENSQAQPGKMEPAAKVQSSSQSKPITTEHAVVAPRATTLFPTKTELVSDSRKGSKLQSTNSEVAIEVKKSSKPQHTATERASESPRIIRSQPATTKYTVEAPKVSKRQPIRSSFGAILSQVDPSAVPGVGSSDSSKLQPATTKFAGGAPKSSRSVPIATEHAVKPAKLASISPSKMKSSSSATSPAARKAAGMIGKSPRKSSPKIVIQTSPGSQGSKRSFYDGSNDDEDVKILDDGFGVGEQQYHQRRSASPSKRRKLGAGRDHSSPVQQNSSSQTLDSNIPGSSRIPIEIDDSQDFSMPKEGSAKYSIRRQAISYGMDGAHEMSGGHEESNGSDSESNASDEQSGGNDGNNDYDPEVTNVLKRLMDQESLENEGSIRDSVEDSVQEPVENGTQEDSEITTIPESPETDTGV